jgi:predicted  nucleic acid-binding Zn-ribbon protein
LNIIIEDYQKIVEERDQMREVIQEAGRERDRLRRGLSQGEEEREEMRRRIEEMEKMAGYYGKEIRAKDREI